MSRYPKSLLSGLIGAAAVTLFNEGVRRMYKKAPRLEELGMEAGAKTLAAAGADVPAKEPLYWGTMVADLISNALYYSLIGMVTKRKGWRWAIGAGLGLAAGTGAVLLPKPLELDESTTARSPQTAALTVGWYLSGALIATAIAAWMVGEEDAG